MAKASSKDVAALAGVSIATVSHVINNTRPVNDKTRKKVLDAITALNYHPNAVARSLATNTTRKIGLIVSDITNPFFTSVARGVEDEAMAHRYSTIFCNSDEDPAREEEYLRILAAQQVDGLIVAPTGVRSESLIALAESNVPIVQLDRRSPAIDAPVVEVNNEDGAYQAVQYLIELGHRRIAYLMGIASVSTQIDRMNGWKRALIDAHLPVDEELIVRADPRFYGIQSSQTGPLVAPPFHPEVMPSAYDVLQELVKLPNRPTAIFVGNNQLTLGTLYALRAGGLQCPEDISLIGFDDNDYSLLVGSPLTVVRQPTYQIGKTAAQLLMRMINGERFDIPPPLPVELIIRSSCGALPGGTI